jgi:hypothetical protein
LQTWEDSDDLPAAQRMSVWLVPLLNERTHTSPSLQSFASSHWVDCIRVTPPSIAHPAPRATHRDGRLVYWQQTGSASVQVSPPHG